ncbi:MAG: ribosome silencing factor [Firmicutes bacterium]|nr:ribosome silencing factor [Bacillota bacterium]HPU01455.1 ribosome silencing factor [Bacillota bacterium]
MSEAASSSRELALWAAELAAEKKAEDLILLEVSKVSIIADYFLIATGRTRAQVHAICDYLMEKFRERRRPLLGLEGYQEGWWVVLDYGDLVIHLFQPEAREFYNLERLWSRAPLVEIRPRDDVAER